MSLVAAAICSYAPILLPEYASQADAGAPVRSAGRLALDIAQDRGVDRLVVLAPHTPPGRTRWAGNRHARPELALRVARVLLDGAGPDRAPVEEIVLDGSASEPDVVSDLRGRTERLGLLVLADAPAHDGAPLAGPERRWLDAIRDGDAAAASRLSGGDAVERLGDTAAGLRVLGGVAAGAHLTSTVLYDEATGGVDHVAAVWVAS